MHRKVATLAAGDVDASAQDDGEEKTLAERVQAANEILLGAGSQQCVGPAPGKFATRTA